MMTTFTPLLTLETQHGLETPALYKLLAKLNLIPKRTPNCLYLNAGQVALLENLLTDLQDSHPGLSLLEYIETLETAAFLYQCTNCGELWISSTLLTDNNTLVHACSLTFGRKTQQHGSYELIASGPLSEITQWQHSLSLGLDQAKKAI